MRRLTSLLVGALVVGGCIGAEGPPSSGSPSPVQAPTPRSVAVPTSLPPVPTAAASSAPAPTSVAPVATPSAAGQVGVAWKRVSDPDLVGLPVSPWDGLNGVVAGGPGAIAWGRVEGVGPSIWTSLDGRDWARASVEAPTGAQILWLGGGVLDVTAGGPGYVAVGGYRHGDDPGATALIWTSTDARSWRIVPTGRAFGGSLISQVVNWRGELLAFGWGPYAGQTAPSLVWTYTDGVAWTRHTPSIPVEIAVLNADVTPSADALWATGFVGTGITIDDPQAPQPPRFTSPDGRTWALADLPVLSGEDRLHSLPLGLYLTVPRGGTATSAAWMTRTPGVFRSTDLQKWTPLAVGQPLGDEIIAVGDTLVMIKTAWGSIGAWRSTDGGRTWEASPIAGKPAAGATSSTMSSVAALPDGTLVAVGADHGSDLDATAAWVASPRR